MTHIVTERPLFRLQDPFPPHLTVAVQLEFVNLPYIAVAVKGEETPLRLYYSPYMPFSSMKHKNNALAFSYCGCRARAGTLTLAIAKRAQHQCLLE